MTGEADKTSPYGIWYIRNSDIWDYFKILNKEILDFSEILYKGKSLGSLKCDNELSMLAESIFEKLEGDNLKKIKEYEDD